MVERAEAVAPPGGSRLLAEEERLHALVVALGLLELVLRLVPEQPGEHEAAQRHRRELEQALAPVGVDRDDLLVQLLELAHVLADRLLRLRDAAVEQLDVRLHRDRAPEVDRLVGLPEELVDELLRGGDVALALVPVRLVGRELQVHLGRLARDVAPRARVLIAFAPVDQREKPLVDLRRLAVALVVDEDLAPRVARLLVELADVLRRLRVRLEELGVDLRAVVLAPAEEEVVRDHEPRRPVLRALAVGKRRHLLLRLLELPEREHAADLVREERRLGRRPLLLRRRDDVRREVGVAVLDERRDVVDLVLKGLVLLVAGRLRRVGGGSAERRERRQSRRRASEEKDNCLATLHS